MARREEERTLKEAKKNGIEHDVSSKNVLPIKTPDGSSMEELKSTATTTQAKLEKKSGILAKGLKKQSLLDSPLHDPRAPSPTSYFLNLPKIGFHAPPYTLHTSGSKSGPAACLLSPLSFWRGFNIQFSPALSSPGVMDARDVVSPLYGTEDGKDGFLKGYKVGKRRWLAGGGKEWWEAQKAEGFKDNERMGERRIRVEEVVRLRWRGRGGVRGYGFEWRGKRYLWKGTGRAVGVKTIASPFVRWSHLKLVVAVPVKEAVENEIVVGEQAKRVKKETELCLAMYTCTMGNRKAGRLEIFEEVLDSFVRDHDLELVVVFEDDQVADVAKNGTVLATMEGSKPMLNEMEVRTRQRLKDVIVGTALSMIIIERNKRRFLLELLQQIGENAG